MMVIKQTIKQFNIQRLFGYTVTVGFIYLGTLLLWALFIWVHCYCGLYLLGSTVTVGFIYLGTLLLWALFIWVHCYCGLCLFGYTVTVGFVYLGTLLLWALFIWVHCYCGLYLFGYTVTVGFIYLGTLLLWALFSNTRRTSAYDVCKKFRLVDIQRYKVYNSDFFVSGTYVKCLSYRTFRHNCVEGLIKQLIVFVPVLH